MGDQALVHSDVILVLPVAAQPPGSGARRARNLSSANRGALLYALSR